METYGSKTRYAAINGNYPRSFHLIALPGSSTLTNKGKGKIHPGTGHEGSKAEERYSSTLSLISALDGVGNQRLAPATLIPVTLPQERPGTHCTGGSTPSPGHFSSGHFTPGGTRYPLYRR